MDEMNMPEVPFDGPFTAQQARESGITPNALTRLVHRGIIVRLRRGVYAPAQELSAQARIRAACLTAPQGAILGFEAAAILLNIPIPHSHGLTRVDLYVAPGTPHGGGRPPSEVRLHYLELPPEQTAQTDGYAVTSVARTAIDVSRGQPFERALIALDHALSIGVRLSALYDARFAASGNRGVAILDDALRHASHLAESPFESISRGVLIRAALPLPVLQQSLAGCEGGPYRVDFYWADSALIGEADGMGKYAADPDAFRREKRREDDLRLAGYHFVRWTWDELLRQPDVVVQRIRTALGNCRRLPYSRNKTFKA